MALEAETVRPLIVRAAGGDDGAAPAAVFLATARDRPVDPVIWGDEKRMKRELVAWAKAVASMAASSKKNTSSSGSSSLPSSPWPPSMSRRG